MPAPPWKLATGLPHVLEQWERSGSVKPCITASRALSPSSGSHAPFPAGLSPSLVAALKSRGVESLYDHQTRAFEAATGGRHIVVATPTASGKSLCFHLPVLDALAKDRETTALFLYPTKALARDQEVSVRELVQAAGLSSPAIVYDGDTPGDARRAARERSSIIMTNPDMLHSGILPHHAGWARALSKLRYVVLDELHTYRGVFGSHVAHVLARLVRIARFHGANPTFLCATATIGNPREHAARLLNVAPEQIELLAESGAPRGERRVFVYNPPVVNRELGIRASYLKSTVRLTTDLLRARVPTIVFGPSRNSVEIMLKYLRDALAGEIHEDAIMAYRGGYLPEKRRAIERGLREGSILGVVATNALELGIDIGDLDAVVCAGYPGSVAGTWQRFGRAGRRGKLSAAVLVTASHAVDQFMALHPEHVLDSAAEEARIDPENTEIVIQHLKCAAFELPFHGAEPYAVLPASETREALGFLAHNGVLNEQGDRFHWATDKYPANHVSLRSVGWDNTVIIDVGSGMSGRQVLPGATDRKGVAGPAAEKERTLGELDWRATPTMLHEQAIYQHDGEQYQVERLDHEHHKAYVRKVDPDYFTTAMTNRKVTPIDNDAERPLFRGTGVLGEVSVIEKVVGFKKIKFFTHENAGYGDIRLPDIQMHTTSFWWSIPAAACLELGVGRAAAIDGLRGILRALETVATIALMCEPRDIGQSLEDGDLGSGPSLIPSAESEPQAKALMRAGGAPSEGSNQANSAHFDPTLFLFDNVPGGIGLAPRIYEQAETLLARVDDLLSRCECEVGCPLCVGAVDVAPIPGAVPPAPRKKVSLELLRHLVSGRAQSGRAASSKAPHAASTVGAAGPPHYDA